MPAPMTSSSTARAVLAGEPGAQVEGLRIAVPAAALQLVGDGGCHPGRDAEQALIGAEAELEAPPRPPLDRLGADEGHRCRQPGDDGR